MSPAVITLIAGVVMVIVLGVLVTGIFKRLVTYRNRYKNAFAQIEVQLNRMPPSASHVTSCRASSPMSSATSSTATCGSTSD